MNTRYVLNLGYDTVGLVKGHVYLFMYQPPIFDIATLRFDGSYVVVFSVKINDSNDIV